MLALVLVLVTGHSAADSMTSAHLEKAKMHLGCAESEFVENTVDGISTVSCSSHKVRTLHPLILKLKSGILCLGTLKRNQVSGYVKCHDQNVLRQEKYYEHSIPNGGALDYDDKGRLRVKKWYTGNLLEGFYVQYDEEKNPLMKIMYNKGKKNGIATYYYPKSNKDYLRIHWKDDIVDNGLRFDESGKYQVIAPAELKALAEKLEKSREDLIKLVEI